MSQPRPLRGSCNCGRYNYVISVPVNGREHAHVHFRTDDEHRRSQAALLTAFLRVPLAWYSTHTVPYFPDETHSSIAKTFLPIDDPHCQRKFCGYCGTHLSYWTENPREERDYMHITLGSLRNQDLDRIQDLDMLPEDLPLEHVADADVAMGDTREALTTTDNQDPGTTRAIRRGEDDTVTWFEEMLHGSHLGRTRKTRRGIGTSADGTTTISWEVTEYTGDNEEVAADVSGTGAKRKLEDVSADRAPLDGRAV